MTESTLKEGNIETPRTDEFYEHYLPPRNSPGRGYNDSEEDSIEFARKLEHELAEARCALSKDATDAERYRWLRDRWYDYKGEVAFYEHDKGIDYKPRRGTKLDAAIDAAMQEAPK